MTGILGRGSNAKQATAAGSLQFQTSQQGGVIPLVYGTTRVAPNLLDQQDFTATPAPTGAKGKGGGAGKSGSGQFQYSASVILGVCQGPIDNFGLVWWDKNIDPLAGLAGMSYFVFGNDGQSPSSFWLANHPANAIGYSGTAYFEMDNYQLGMSPTLPSFNVEVQGILSGTAPNLSDANPGEIVTDFLTNDRYGAGFPAANLDTSGSVADYGNYCNAAGIFLAPMLDQQQEAQQSLADIVQLTNSAIVWSGGLLKIIPYGDQTLEVSYAVVSVAGTVAELDTLSLTFAAAGLSGSPVTITYQAQPATVNADTTDYSAGMAGLAQNINGSGALSLFGITAGSGVSACVIALRNSAFATTVTVTAASTGAASFTITGPTAYTWTPDTTVIYDLGEDDFIVQESSVGITLGPNPGGPALRQGATPITGGFTDDPVHVTRSSPADADNYVQLECLDRANAYNTTIVDAFDQGSIDLYGVRKDTSLKARAIVDFLGVAPIVAQLVLQRGLLYRNTYSFQLGWKYCLLEPMDLVAISDSRLGLANQTVRITSVVEDEEGTLSITAEDFF
ncbi:MAG: phage tail protein, partial [Stellaceae bacterium]